MSETSLPDSVAAKIREIEIRTRHWVQGLFAGEYRANFRGRGLEFDEVRPYLPGDDLRLIDWNVTARMPEPYIKQFIEERELTVLLVVDGSASGDFGSGATFKRELAAELAAVLAFAASNNHDRVGLLLFTDSVELLFHPQRGRKHVLHLVREVLTYPPKQAGTNLQQALQATMRLLKRRSIVFIISDFLMNPASYANDLRILGSRHDVIALDIHDPLEQELPPIGLIQLTDPETDATFIVDTADPMWRKSFTAARLAHADDTLATWRAARVENISIQTNKDYVGALDRFFRQRAHAHRHRR